MPKRKTFRKRSGKNSKLNQRGGAPTYYLKITKKKNVSDFDAEIIDDDAKSALKCDNSYKGNKSSSAFDQFANDYYANNSSNSDKFCIIPIGEDGVDENTFKKQIKDVTKVEWDKDACDNPIVIAVTSPS